VFVLVLFRLSLYRHSDRDFRASAFTNGIVLFVLITNIFRIFLQ